jgi:hypothetical protein
MDNQFNTQDIISYLDSLHITYQFAPPYEHEFIGRIERNNRTTQDKLSCALAISASKNKKLWLYALTDAISKLNVVPRKHLNWETPYFKWFGIPYDFLSKPLLPFGCKVMAHTSVENQSKLSPNSVLYYYVGSAPHTKQGILLYNPSTKQVIIRRSYQQLNTQDQELPTLQLQIHSPTSTDTTQFLPTANIKQLRITHHLSSDSPESLESQDDECRRLFPHQRNLKWLPS